MLEKLLLQISSIAHGRSDVSHDSLVVFCNEVDIIILYYIKNVNSFLFTREKQKNKGIKSKWKIRCAFTEILKVIKKANND